MQCYANQIGGNNVSFKQKAIEALETYKSNFKGFHAAATAQGCIEIIKQLPEDDGWIPATERLPEEFVSVLVHIPGESPLPTVKETYLAGRQWYTRFDIYTSEEVTHWMPLPEPPKEVL